MQRARIIEKEVNTYTQFTWFDRNARSTGNIRYFDGRNYNGEITRFLLTILPLWDSLSLCSLLFLSIHAYAGAKQEKQKGEPSKAIASGRNQKYPQRPLINGENPTNVTFIKIVIWSSDNSDSLFLIFRDELWCSAASFYEISCKKRSLTRLC